MRLTTEGEHGRHSTSVHVAVLRPKRGDGVEPVSFGVLLRQGDVTELPAMGRLVSPDGTAFAGQLKPLSCWFDGSIRWMLVDAVLTRECTIEGLWRVELGSVSGSSTTGAIQAADTKPSDDVRRFLLDESKWTLLDEYGRVHVPQLSEVETIASGPVRTTLRQAGSFPKLRGMRVEVEWSFYGGTLLARCAVTLHNARRAVHRGGLWDLGDTGSHLFRDFSFTLPLSAPGEASIRLTEEAGVQSLAAENQIHLYQDSSGGENWQSLAHVNRAGRVPCRFRGYELNVDGAIQTGCRATPSVVVRTGGRRICAVFPDFWQQFPKALEVDKRQLRFGLFPREWDDLHELQGGEQKTHIFWVGLESNEDRHTNLDWVFAPTRFLPANAACADAGTLTDLTTCNGHASEGLAVVLEETIAGPRSFLSLRERVDEYGWRNYGDVFADHEQLHYQGERSLISHYNNQFDVLGGLLLQSLHTRDERWFDLAEQLARHVIDVDIYHTNEDRAAYNGGMFWFTDHYLHAHTSTHRTYSRQNAPQDGRGYGGGPGAEHNYTSGLLLYYHLTGEEGARKAVIGLADWVLRMEDGRRNILGIIDDGPTGLATVGYAKPGRGGANSINALLDAWQLTHEHRYLEACETLIRRCVHPGDDPGKLDLLNVEVSWSYTMFYSSLAKYLRLKEEAGQVDAMYAYSRQCLLNIGRWMFANEQPYFDQLEKLEFPTETWAAQELRKANVLRYAARYATEPEQRAMLDRANELGDRAWSDLLRFETRTAARAVALVMTEGLYDCALRMEQDEKPPVIRSISNFPSRRPFVAQRQRVLSMLRSPQGLLLAAMRIASPRRWYKYWQVARRRRECPQ